MKKLYLFLWVITRKSTYIAIFRSLFIFYNPIKIYFSLLFDIKLNNVIIRHNNIPIEIHINSNEDIKTIIGVFCRLDYRVCKNELVIIDIGGNIGISSLYFLLASQTSKVFTFEPFPQNIALLKKNTKGFNQRIQINEVAISETYNGKSVFYIEESGKFCSLIKSDNNSINVDTLDINRILEIILNIYPKIDILKVDVEGLEENLINAIKVENLKKINTIFCENTNCYKFEQVNKNFNKKWYYNIEKLINKI
jgi:FkbM family methyltransferase